MRLPSKVISLGGFLLLVLANWPGQVDGRKHNLHLVEDYRRLIHITSFGFFKGGFMEVKVHDIHLDPAVGTGKGNKQIVGFTVDRTLKDGINPYPHDIESSCALTPKQPPDESTSSILFALDFASKSVKVECSNSLLRNVLVFKSSSSIPMSIQGTKSMSHFPNMMTQPQRRKRNAEDGEIEPAPKVAEGVPKVDGTGLGTLGALLPQDKPAAVVEGKVSDDVGSKREETPSKIVDIGNQKGIEFNGQPAKMESSDGQGEVSRVRLNNQASDAGGLKPLDSSEETNDEQFVDPASTCSQPLQLNATTLPNNVVSYSFSFAVYIAGEDCEGLYNLYFHNCAEDYGSRVTLNISLVEENLHKNYLSAGEMPLPALYFMMSVLFFMAGCFWVFILKKSKRETGVSVFKIHYLMAALVFVKSLSLLFHSINYHFIQTEGAHIEGWAVLYYITHLLKGALLFITILLIGTGFSFVKHLLSDKDKKLFMMVIPLQVLANVAQIIIEESEEGEVVHTTWQVIFISVDLLCCCAILFPVVWSIRHLQEASQTDGKAASNLRKLKLFRHFYIIVVCYIYFTRIIVQMLLKITVPFQYEWLDDMFREMTTFIFFVLTGYKFRPAANNPYLELAHDSEDEEMDTVITESGLNEGAVKRGYKPKKKTLKEIVLFDPNEEETDDDEEVLLEKRREASHDLD